MENTQEQNKVSDEQFMLALELGNILRQEGYDMTVENIDRSKVTNVRALEILDRLEELSANE